MSQRTPIRYVAPMSLFQPDRGTRFVPIHSLHFLSFWSVHPMLMVSLISSSVILFRLHDCTLATRSFSPKFLPQESIIFEI